MCQTLDGILEPCGSPFEQLGLRLRRIAWSSTIRATLPKNTIGEDPPVSRSLGALSHDCVDHARVPLSLHAIWFRARKAKRVIKETLNAPGTLVSVLHHYCSFHCASLFSHSLPSRVFSVVVELECRCLIAPPLRRLSLCA